MDKVACISFPRSGHHLLINGLLKYFSKDPTYPNIEDSTRCKNILQAGELFYCEYYDHCRNHPCSDYRSNFQKIHDFNLDLICKIEKQIVQIRHPIESIISYYKYHYGENLLEKEHWIKFALEKADYWKGFVKKWVIENSSSKLLVISYSDLLDKSLETFENILYFIAPKDKLRKAYLKKVIASLDISKKNTIDKFDHYDIAFLRNIEIQLLKVMKLVKILPLFVENESANVSLPFHNKLVIATSLAPNNERIQKAAIDSWRKNGFDIISLNVMSEIEKFKNIYPDIHFMKAEKDAMNIFGKPYVFLDDLLCTLKTIKPEICGIINSDIVMPPLSRLKETLLDQLKINNLIYGSRVEVKSLERLEGEFYNNGFDMFFFKPELTDLIPKSLSSMGVTWWDYWLPLAAALAGAKLKKLNFAFGYHVSHQTRWSDEQWKFMGIQIANTIYNMRLQAGSNIGSQKELIRLDTMIRSAAYFALSNKTLNKSEKIYASYFNLETFGKAVLEFLTTESENIFSNENKKDPNKQNYLLHKTNRLAEIELKKNRTNIAIKHLLNALKIDAHYPITLCNLGKAAFQRGEVEKSIYYYKLCLEKNPYHPNATYNCGKMLLKIDQKKLAEKLYSIYTQRYPGDLKIANALLEIDI